MKIEIKKIGEKFEADFNTSAFINELLNNEKFVNFFEKKGWSEAEKIAFVEEMINYFDEKNHKKFNFFKIFIVEIENRLKKEINKNAKKIHVNFIVLEISILLLFLLIFFLNVA